MHALVTGGAGFIGSHLVDHLLAMGATVTVLDDFSTGRRANLARHQQRATLRIITGSILDRVHIEEALAGVELVFHLAAAVGVQQIVGSPVRSIVTNATGTHNVLELASQRGLPVLLTSTSEVYGKSVKPRFSEDDDLVLGATTRPRWSYAASKALDEYLALAYHHERGLPVFVVRLFNTIGPRQTGRYGMVVPRFVRQALTGEALTIYGDGKQTRAFVHIADIVPALVAFATTPKLAGEVINLGSEEEVTIQHLAERVRKLTGSTSAITYVPYDDAYDRNFEDMRRRCPDLTKARRLLGFTPKRSLDAILGDIIGHLRANPDL